MSGLTEGEWRGARILAVLLLVGTAADLWEARHPRMAAALPVAAAVAPVPESLSVRPADGRLDLNAADAAALDGLPGIGPVLAARIVAHRTAQGPYRHVDDLLAVPGIGPRLLERLRSRLRDPAPGTGRTAPQGEPAPR